jgi:hypothetical protein
MFAASALGIALLLSKEILQFVEKGDSKVCKGVDYLHTQMPGFCLYQQLLHATPTPHQWSSRAAPTTS